MTYNILNTLQEFKISNSKTGKFYSLPVLEKKLKSPISRLPISIRIILESLLRNYDNQRITLEHIKKLAHWNSQEATRIDEIPFIVARVILQDFTGVPLLTDLAAMRSVTTKLGKNPKKIEPLVPVDLIIDHSVQIDYFRNKKALDLNMKLEFQRNNERYQFIKWGMQAFNTFNVIPPGFGIIHQINLEYLAKGVHNKKELYYPDTLVGTDSHTTMINSIGVVGWGVGGIEAEASMLGQPIYFLTPDVIGVHLSNQLREGVTATDLVLTITELLRKAKVVGKFVEFFGPGTQSLSLTDRATIANMAPEYGSTTSFFPIDETTLDYFKNTGRTATEINAFEAYFKAQNLFGIPQIGDIDYTYEIQLDLSTVTSSLAGPNRPQDRIEISEVKKIFTNLFVESSLNNGFNKKIEDLNKIYVNSDGISVKNGDILIAAITSCTNTSNPHVLITAGLLAKKAVQAGLKVASHIKTSLAPGSRVVTKYLEAAGLLPYLEKLGFGVTAYGCTTCIGNAGDLTPAMNEIIIKNNIIVSAILSGNRNFEARIHPNIRANFLASPPLVIAFAIAGNINIDLVKQPISTNNNKNIYLRDIWPKSSEIEKLLKFTINPKFFQNNYANIKNEPGKLWENIQNNTSNIKENNVYHWPISTYITKPPFFKNFTETLQVNVSNIIGARALGIFGDSITTDHISPAGLIKESSPAGKWLQNKGILKKDYNSYGSRRGNYKIMVRGTFDNVRIRNLMVPNIEGGITIHHPSKKIMSIYEAAMLYMKNHIPTIIFGGEDYGTGSSRDWAAKGTQLLGVKAVIARSFERIHRSNLVGMGILPLQFIGNDSTQNLHLTGEELYDLKGLHNEITPQQHITLISYKKNGEIQEIKLLLRIDTQIEINYYKNGGILPFVLRKLLMT